MRRALELARKAVEETRPNPRVGAVVVTRIEDRTEDLGEDDKGRPFVSWLRLYEMDIEARFVGRQSRGL